MYLLLSTISDTAMSYFSICQWSQEKMQYSVENR